MFSTSLNAPNKRETGNRAAYVTKSEGFRLILDELQPKSKKNRKRFNLVLVRLQRHCHKVLQHHLSLPQNNLSLVSLN